MKGRTVHCIAAGLGAVAALAFLHQWLATGAPFLIAMAVFIAGCIGYAGWTAVDMFEALRPLWQDAGPAAQSPIPPGIPELSKSRAARVRQIVAALADEGVFQPEVPPPAALYPPVAERDEVPNQEVVLTALFEADYHDRSFEPARYMANLAFHDSKSEQFAETIESQVADLARLCGDALAIEGLEVDDRQIAGKTRGGLCVIRFRAAGKLVELRYLAASKYLSTVLHVTVAQALREAGSIKRLAWLWNDQGAWIAALQDGGVDRLNAAAGAVTRGYEGWSWIDQAQPVIAGEG